MLKRYKNFVILILTGAAMVATYLLFAGQVRKDNLRIFDVQKTISWGVTGPAIYRPYVRGNIENILLSETGLRDFNYRMAVLNPVEFGFVFDYTGGDYGFFYLKKNPPEVFAGQLTQGKMQIVRRARFESAPVCQVQVTKKAGEVVLHVNGRAVINTTSQSTTGKIGIMVNTVVNPPMLFNDILLEGTGERGQKIEEHSQSRGESAPGQVLLNFLPFFVFFLLFITSAVRTMAQRELREGTIKSAPTAFLKSAAPVAFPVILSAFFFWPFFARGEIAVFSYDNLGEIYPLFFYCRELFGSIVTGQGPWLWNPFVHNGFPFWSNHWDMIYYPLNWPVFLCPRDAVLSALTFKAFVEVALTGIFACGFFKAELRDSRWALFCAVIYQLGSVLIFTMGIFPATSTYFAMTFYLYLLWTVPSRKARANFILLTGAVYLLLTSANVAFIFYAGLALGAVTVYRLFTASVKGPGLFLITAGSAMTGLLLSSIRILSCLEGVTSSNRMADNFHTIHDRVFMFIRLFIPEIAGWMGPESLDVLKSPNLGIVFRQFDIAASNPQNSFFAYFGVIPALFLGLGLVSPAKGRAVFWKVFSLITLAITLLWQPVWGVLSILCLPLNHFSYTLIILPVGICAWIGHIAMDLQKEGFPPGLWRNLAIFLGLTGAYGIVFLTYLFPGLEPFSRWILIAVILMAGLYAYARVKSRPLFEVLTVILGIAAQCLAITLLIVATILLSLSPLPKKESLGTAMILPFLWFFAAGIFWARALLWGRQKINGHYVLSSIIAPAVISLAAAGIFVLSPGGNNLLNLAAPVRVYAVDVLLGFSRLVLLVTLGITLLKGLERKLITLKTVFAALLCLTALDLIMFNARFNAITAPFYFKNAFYPRGFAYRNPDPGLTGSMDLVNYRVNRLDRAEMGANKNIMSGIPSYSGSVGYMTSRYSKLLETFGYPRGIYLLYPEDATDDDRFLDLSAVRYEFDENGKVRERTTALARLNLLYEVQPIAGDDQQLSRLKSPDFDLHRTVIIPENPGYLFNGRNKSAPVLISRAKPDRIEASVSTLEPAILLFVESYDPGWKVFVDGKSGSVIRANYNFMACPIPFPGSHKVVFVYQPAAFYKNMLLSLSGLLVLVLSALSFFLPKIKITRN